MRAPLLVTRRHCSVTLVWAARPQPTTLYLRLPLHSLSRKKYPVRVLQSFFRVGVWKGDSHSNKIMSGCNIPLCLAAICVSIEAGPRPPPCWPPPPARRGTWPPAPGAGTALAPGNHTITLHYILHYITLCITPSPDWAGWRRNPQHWPR